ncbi:CFI-box-CTERM domain-containing protein [Variovorax sp. J22G40]
MTDKKDPKKSPNQTGGPVVKTGPTAGQNRSRNQDGAWRKKRSDAETPKKSGCFLTSAACMHRGLPDDCHELNTLRNFRDTYLAQFSDGRALIAHYYEVAPAIAAKATQSDLDYVWQVIGLCIRQISEGQRAEACGTYSQMVRHLADKHAVVNG